jgi:hypothetical protein
VYVYMQKREEEGGAEEETRRKEEEEENINNWEIWMVFLVLLL